MAYLGMAYSNSASGAGNENLGVALGSAQVSRMEERPAGRNLGPHGAWDASQDLCVQGGLLARSRCWGSICKQVVPVSPCSLGHRRVFSHRENSTCSAPPTQKSHVPLHGAQAPDPRTSACFRCKANLCLFEEGWCLFITRNDIQMAELADTRSHVILEVLKMLCLLMFF